MKLSDIEGIMHGSVGVKLEDLVGKVLEISFIKKEMKKEHGGHGDWISKNSGTHSEIMKSVALGYTDKKLLLIENYYLKSDKDIIKLNLKSPSRPSNLYYYMYEITSIIVQK